MVKLYRGTSDNIEIGTNENKFLNTPRRPKDTPESIHKIADYWFFNKFGIYARSQTVFCTTDKEQASQYGKVYEIFPTDISFAKFILSKKVYDFTEIMCNLTDYSNQQQVENWLEEKNYQIYETNENIPNDFSGEIMLYCNTYEIREI